MFFMLSELGTATWGLNILLGGLIQQVPVAASSQGLPKEQQDQITDSCKATTAHPALTICYL